MEADSIGDDLEPFLLDIMSGTDLHNDIHTDLLDEVYDQQTNIIDQQSQPTFRMQNSHNNVQNIIPRDNQQYPIQYYEDEASTMDIGMDIRVPRVRNFSETNHSPPSIMINNSPERFSHHSSPGSTPPFAAGNTPPQSAVEELQVSHIEDSHPQNNTSPSRRVSPKHEIQTQELKTILSPQNSRPSQSNTVYIIQPVNVQNIKPGDLGGHPKKPKKVERNKAHNAIEKRYRHSINDRIDDLRGILGGKDQKMSKSVVLRQAIEEIVMLRKRNQQLERELRKYGQEPQQQPQFDICEYPPHDSPELSPEPPMVEDEPLRIGGRNSVRSDITRMIYCISGIFALFMPFHDYLGGYFNPLRSNDGLMDDEFEVHHTGRVLLNEDTVKPDADDIDVADIANKIIQTWSSILMFFFLNGAIFLYLMYRGLVYMEPITPMDSSEYKQFQKSFDMAQRDFSRHNLESSRSRLTYCLTSLGRFRASTTIEGMASILWSLLLYFSNKSGIKWFVCCLASKLGSDAQADSSRMAALAYYMLGKVEFAEMEKYQVPRASIISYAAQSILLMEQAKEKMTPNEICEIYIQSSIIIRSLLPRFLSKIICRRIHRRAANIARKTELEGTLAWLSHPLGETFLREPKLHALRSTYCSSSMTLCPVSTLSRAFRGHLFERVTNALCNRYKHDMEEILELLTLLQTCSKSTTDDEYRVVDKVAFWWSVILTWNLHESDPECPKDAVSDKMKADMEIVINNIPHELNPEYNSTTNPVQLLAVTNYCAYKASIGEIPVDCTLGTLTVMNETLESSLQTIVVEQNKIDRITGLQLSAASADLVLCIVQKSYNQTDMNYAEGVALAESARSTIGIMRNILSILPATVNRLEKWESFLSTINDCNPVGIYASIRLFRDQKVNCDEHSSDSDSEFANPIELCRQTKIEARKLLRSCLPEPFMHGVTPEDKGIT